MIDVLLIEDLGQQRLQARKLAAALRAAGLSAGLVDSRPGDEPGWIVDLVRDEPARWVVFSVLFAHLLGEYLDLAFRLRAEVPGVRLALAGPLPALAREALLASNPALDAVLEGDLETAVVAMAGSQAPGLPESAGQSRPDDAHEGLNYTARRSLAPRGRQGSFHLGSGVFRRPARDGGIPVMDRQGYGYVTIESSRGCWHNCTFCLPRAFHVAGPGPAYCLRSIADLVDEIESLYERGARLFLFDDEQFLPPRGKREARVRELAGELQRRGLLVAFTAKLRPDDVDESLCREMQAAGLIRAYLGVESGSQVTLELLGKGISPGDSLRALAVLDALGVVADFRTLLFHPWTTPDTLRADLDFLREVLTCTPTLFTYREVELYPGTPLAKRHTPENARPPYPLPYAIPDARAELLRRLGRLVFGPRDAPGGLHERLTTAWYDALLVGRFGSSEEMGPSTAAAELRASVAALNAASLDVWNEMLDFAVSGDIHDPAAVNGRATAWASRIAALDLATG